MLFYKVPAPDQAMLVSGGRRQGGAPFRVVIGRKGDFTLTPKKRGTMSPWRTAQLHLIVVAGCLLALVKLVLRPGGAASEAALIEHTRTLIASYKKPRSIDFVESLPRLFNGKIDKKALRAPYWQNQDRQVS